MGKVGKPKNCHYPNCFECSYRDCRYSRLEESDRILQNLLDEEIKNEYTPREVLLRRESQKIYEKTEKARERQKRYEQTEKGKARQKKYSQSKKGKENEKRKRQKAIESGKNAERCRRYYQRKKQQKLEMTNTIVEQECHL